MAQQIAVFAIVLAAALYAAWKLLPSAVVARAAAALLARAGALGVSNERIARWRQRATAKACGACDSCGACAPTKPEAARNDRTVVRIERV